jgi:thiamine pyrophosphokinase
VNTQALIFANGEMNDGAAVQRVLASAPDALVIAADGGARIARYFGLKVDIVVGDLDSLDTREVAILEQDGVEIQRHPPEKNETDLELALMLAVEKGISWVRVIGALGGRLDQMLSNVYLLALPALAGLDVRLVAGKEEAWLAQAGETVIDGVKGDTVSLIPLSGVVEGVETQGLYYPLRHETLRFGPARGVSNVMVTERAQVRLQTGTLLIVHTDGRA